MNPIDEMLQLENELVIHGLEWAEKDPQARWMDEMTKSILADLASKKPGDSMAARESMARADERFLTHLEGLKVAREMANKARVMYDTTEKKIEIRRSANAVKRAEMGLGR